MGNPGLPRFKTNEWDAKAGEGGEFPGFLPFKYPWWQLQRQILPTLEKSLARHYKAMHFANSTKYASFDVEINWT